LEKEVELFRKHASMILPFLLVLSSLALAFNVQPVKSDYAWTETIYIRADGSIDPSTAPISSVDNVTYTLTDNIAGNVPAYASAIIIQRDNIIIDGAGHTLQGTQAPDTTGIELTGRSNATIKNMEITAFGYGILLYSSSNNSVSGNNVTANNEYGVWLETSNNNSVSGNNITANNLAGIELDSSSNNNSVSGNNITANNEYGIRLGSSYENSVSGNDITANNNAGLSLYSSNNNSVSGNNITNNLDGIYLGSSNNNRVSGNNIANNDNGIVLGSSSDDNSVSGNNITASNYNGIGLSSSSDNSVSGNSVTANKWAGIFLFSSSNNSVSGNNIANNVWGIGLDSSSNNNSVSGNNITANANFGIWISTSSNSNSVSGNSFVKDGLLVDYSYGNVVTGNLVNGKPLVYLEDVSDYAVGDAGQVILVNCNNVTVENLNLINTSIGVELWETNSTTISGNNITANKTASNEYGILLYSSSDNSISGNNMTANNWYGIWLDSSSNNNSVSGNNITNNRYGIYFYSSCNNNSVSGNNIANNVWGILLGYSSDNTICHNNFMNIISQVTSSGSTNVWDEGYPSGGNYWSDYNGTDGNGDGIGDISYVIDANNTDRYPLMAPYSMFDAGTWNGTAYSVGVMSNSTASDFQVEVSQKTLSFNVTGTEGSAGFCRVTIPNVIVQNLWQDNYTVLVDGKPWPFTNWTDTTNTYLYFNYTHFQHQTVIIPELSSSLIFPMLLFVTLLATTASRRKWPKHKTGSRQHPGTTCNK
jgi:parallel beta-helix repeat protein